MAKKKLYNRGGIVYSTAEDFEISNNDETEDFLSPAEQKLSVIVDKKFQRLL
jgi:hypothetical protein